MGIIVTTCPNTDREISTGIETDANAFAQLTDEISRISCQHCGQQHNWSKHNAYLRERTPREWPGKAGGRGRSG